MGLRLIFALIGNLTAAGYYSEVDLRKELEVAVGLVTYVLRVPATSRHGFGSLHAHSQFDGRLKAFAATRLEYRDDLKPLANQG